MFSLGELTVLFTEIKAAIRLSPLGPSLTFSLLTYRVISSINSCKTHSEKCCLSLFLLLLLLLFLLLLLLLLLAAFISLSRKTQIPHFVF